MFDKSTLKKTARLLVVSMAAFLILGLAFLSLSLDAASIQAAPTAQGGSLFLVLPVEKTASHASIYTVTNLSSMTATTMHDFWDNDFENLLHSFSDQLAPFGSKTYDLGTIPEIPNDVVDEVQISSDQPIIGMSNICAPTIQSAGSGDWNAATTWNLNRVPNSSDVVMIQPIHTVVGGPSGQIKALCNFGFLQSKGSRALLIVATGFISNYGYILGSNGSLGTGGNCGGRGVSVILKVKSGPIYNKGTIQAGDGGNGNQCGGPGGSTMVLGRNTTNEGTICAGRGGNVLGSGPGQGGKGGDTHIWGKYGGPGFLINKGLACGGDGGHGFGATGSQKGGNGGNLKLISLPEVLLNGGLHFAGRGGQGTGGGANGRDGQVFIEPNIISLAGSTTQVTGDDIIIFGGNDWILDLSNMSGTAVSATGNITLAVGSGSAIDLRGNANQVVQAGGQVLLASDVISLDGGIVLSDVVGSNFVASTSRILYDVSLVGPGLATGQPGVTLPISLTVLNGGPVTDTYTLGRFDSAGWSLGTLPPSITLAGLDLSDLTLNVTPPLTATSEDTDVITITATSLADPNMVVVAQVEVFVEANRVYLPLILKN